jgi:hypothetical protein
MDTIETKPAETTTLKLTYIDRPDCLETFADSINNLFFDGQTLRIEFGVSRIERAQPDKPATVRRFPACRVALTPAGAADLINQLQQIAAAMTQAGVLKTNPKSDGPAS